jgi:hypothetical protein
MLLAAFQLLQQSAEQAFLVANFEIVQWLADIVLQHILHTQLCAVKQADKSISMEQMQHKMPLVAQAPATRTQDPEDFIPNMQL